MTDSMSVPGHARALLALGLPLAGSHVAQLAIGATDTVMLGWYSVEALAASTLGVSYYFVLFILGSGFAFAVLPMVANAVAAGNRRQARRATRMGMWISVLYGAAATPLLVFSEPILLLLGQEPSVAALAAGYLRIFGVALVPALLVMVLKSHLAALERTRPILWITVAAAALNGILDYALIFGRLGAPELGLLGAAYASLAMQLASLALIVAYMRRALPRERLFLRIWRPDLVAFRRVFHLGWPIGLTNLAESGLFSAAALLMGWLGEIPLAAHGIAAQYAAMTFVVHLGLSQAATVRAGQAMGHGDREGLRDGARAAFLVSLAIGSVVVAAFLLVPELLTSAFVDPDDPARPAIVAVSAALLAVAALFHLADAAQVVALGLLRGLQDTRVPLVVAAVSYWGVGVPASYAFGFPLGWGGEGVWLGLAAGLALAAAVLSLRFWTRGMSWVRPAG